MGRQGKTPNWYNDIRIAICHNNNSQPNQPKAEITQATNSNPFKTNTPMIENYYTKSYKWTATLINNKTIISKKRKMINPNTFIANHMITNNSESPLYKCEGCHINNPIHRKKYINQQQCIIEQNTSDSINVLVQKSKISTISLNKDNQQQLDRIRSTLKGIETALNLIQKNKKTQIPQSLPTIYLNNLSETINLIKQRIKASPKTVQTLIQIA